MTQYWRNFVARLLVAAGVCGTIAAQSQPPSAHGPKLAKPSGGIDVLSDTKGYDLTPYLRRVHQKVYRKWMERIPEEAYPPTQKRGTVSIAFVVTRSGQLEALEVEDSSGSEALDKAAFEAIASSNPLDRLPKDFKPEELKLRFHFLYNPDNPRKDKKKK